MPSRSTRLPASRADSTSCRSTPGLPVAAATSCSRLSSAIGEPSTRWSNASTVSGESGVGSMRRRWLSFTRVRTSPSFEPVVRIVQTTKAVSRVHQGHEQCTRELVELVDVVDHDDPAPPLLHLLERGAGAVEEERAVELALGPARASHLAGEKVGERGKRKTLGLGVPCDASDGQSGLGGEPQALVREPGLAQARAAADEDAACTRVTERRRDRLDLVGSARGAATTSCAGPRSTRRRRR